MKPMTETNSHLSRLLDQEPAQESKNSRCSGQNRYLYMQGSPAYTLFYIQEGGVRLTSRAKHRPSAVTAILGVGDFFLASFALQAIRFVCPLPLH